MGSIKADSITTIFNSESAGKLDAMHSAWGIQKLTGKSRPILRTVKVGHSGTSVLNIKGMNNVGADS
jgi:hypothetical protein